MFSPGRETEVRANGRTWTVGRLTASVIQEWGAWVKEQEGDPFAGLDRLVPLLPKEEAVAMVKAATETAKDLKLCSLSTETAKKHLKTELGIARLVLCLLKPHHPQATMDDAMDIVLAMGQEAMGGVLAEAAGEVPGGNGLARAGTGVSTGTPSTAR